MVQIQGFVKEVNLENTWSRILSFPQINDIYSIQHSSEKIKCDAMRFWGVTVFQILGFLPRIVIYGANHGL